MTRFFTGGRTERWTQGVEANARAVADVGGARLYFGNGELMESETVVVGVQGKGEICGGTRDEAPRKPRGSRPASPAPP